MTPDPICPLGVACWQPGAGYRVVVDADGTCAVDDAPFESKHDGLFDPLWSVVDAYAGAPGAAPIAAVLNPTPSAYAGLSSGPSISGGSWGGSSGGGSTIVYGDTIIRGESSTTIIREIVREGDTIIIVYPDPWEPCGCVEQPEPQPAPVPLPATGLALCAGLLVLAAVRRWR